MRRIEINPAVAGFGGYESVESFFDKHAENVVRDISEAQKADAAAVAAEVDELRRQKANPELDEIDYFRWDKEQGRALRAQARAEYAHEVGLARAADAMDLHGQMQAFESTFFREGRQRALDLHAEKEAERQDTAEWLRQQSSLG